MRSMIALGPIPRSRLMNLTRAVERELLEEDGVDWATSYRGQKPIWVRIQLSVQPKSRTRDD